MTYEATLSGLIGPLMGGKFFPDVPPDASKYPCGVYQQVGGQSLWFREGAMPGHKHARVQITVWAETRLQANQLMRQIEGAICTGLRNAEPFGAMVGGYEDAIKKYSARQDFGFWYPDP